jgi:hypothetical protein
MVSLNVPILARVLRIRCTMTNGVLECPYSRPRAASVATGIRARRSRFPQMHTASSANDVTAVLRVQ